MILTALFFSCFPSVFGTVVILLIISLQIGIPYANARKTIMLEIQEPFITEQTIEKEMAKRYPVLYNIRLYGGVITISLFFFIYFVSFVLILAFGDSLHILLRG